MKFYREIFLSIITIIVLNLLLPKNVTANIIFQDNFSSGIDYSNWDLKNYVSHEEGSFGPISELSLDTYNDTVKLYGIGAIDLYYVNGIYTGWIGKSLMLKSEIPPEGIIQITTDTTIHQDSYNGFMSIITIEFDKNNRVVAYLGNHGSTDQKVALLQVDEQDNFHGCQSCGKNFNFPFDEVINLKLIFNFNNRLVQYFADSTLIAETTYNGNVSNFHTGLASIVRFTGSRINSDYDNFIVSQTLNTTELGVDDVKQFSEPWGTQEYDHASNWSTNNTISRWGCAMTSADMIMNYHGFDFDPGELNTWLKNNSGYLRNGALLWPSIGTYTANHTGPTLEFAYLGSTEDQAIVDEIDDEKPAVIKLDNETYGGNHFIVAKGYGGPDILINDPGSSTNSNLSDAHDYWGNTVNIGSFTPSETDLSYIVLSIDEDKTLSILDANNNPITYQLIKDYPMLNPNDPSDTDGVTLNTYYIPKPESGTYYIKVEGDGPYQLVFDIFDKEAGNHKNSSVFGFLSIDKDNDFILNFDKNNATNSVLPSYSFDKLLNNIEVLNERGLVKSHGLYTSLKSLITNSQKLLSKDNSSASRVLLQVALDKIQEATPEFLDEPSSTSLQSQISYLLNNLFFNF